MKITFNKSNPPLGGLLVAEYVAQRNKMPLEIKWCNESSVANIVCNTSNDVCRTIVKLYCPELTGSTASELTEIDHWLTFSIGPLSSTGGFSNALNYLNNILKPLTFLTAKRITIADFCVFAALHVNDKWNEAVSKNTALPNVLRWYNYIGSFNDVSKILSSLPEEVKTVIRSQSSGGISDKTTAGKVREGGKFVDLPGAEMGKVVVRFPPEASGYLHIGHAKAALLNQYYQEAFEGKLIMRFDDTNPAKENLHFEKVILEDVEMLQIKPDMFTHTSQYFDLMLDYCIQLLKEGKAYVDDTEAELMKQQREQKIESPNRSNSLEKNMMLWDEMLKGTEKGQQCCVRAKIDMQSLNGCMRDPTIYRCKNEPHPRTGDKYKVYPTYDFACPIVDAIEGVTHTLRTMEYHDRDPQFYWFIDALGLRKPYIWEYSRLSMTNTVLSKRKLTWFVNEKLVDGWDDPRMPTVRGVLRRGMTVEGLKEFIIAQGSSRSVVFMEWDKIWAINKKIIDPIAPRYTAVSLSQHVKVFVRNANEECLIVPKHPKNSDVGNKEVWIGQNILIDRVDAECLKEGENATFINWGNLLIKKINRNAEGIINIEAETNLDNKDFKKTLKLTWLPETKKAPFTDCWCVYFDHIISKPLLGKDEDFKAYIGHPTKKEVQMIGDPELKKLKKGDIIQLQRRGFFKVDIAWEPINLSVSRERPIVLFHIPDGHTKENPIKDLIETPKNNETDNQTIKMYTIQKHNYTGTDVIIDKSGVKVVEKIVPKSAFHSIAKHLSSDTTFTDLETNKIEKLNDAIIKQGELIRKLKAEKIDRSKIDPAVKILLNLKADYKKITNKEWAPGVLTQSHVEKQPETQESKIRTPGELNDEIIKQGDIVRNLKMQKTNKNEIDAAVKSLLTLKEDYKKVTNTEWKSGCEVSSVQSSSNKSGSELNAEIIKQGDIVRNLKAQKAVKSAIDVAVKKLLDLKADYKKVTNTDWKPGCTPPTPISNVDNSKSQSAFNLNAEIIKQGDFVRNLKTEKAGKSEIDAAVKVLLNLKADYKNITKTEWKPGCTPPTPLNNTATTLDNPPTTESASNLNAEIVKQGDTVRDLKAQKAAKSEIDAAVKILLNLKADYKKITNTEWKPGCTPAIQLNNKSDNSNNNEPVNNLNAEIIKQGDVVRSLKSQKVPKSEIDAAVKILLNLKSEYKKLTNTDWKPGCTPPTPATNIDAKSNSLTTKSAGNLNAEILKQGDIVRNLKGQKASKSDIDAAVKILLNLKADYKKVTNIDWKPGCIPPTDNVEIMKQEELRQITPGKKTASDINTEIIKQGDLVRNLKAQKAPKSEIDAAVKTLLLLKSDYKSETNIDWKPGCIPPSDEPKVKEKTPSDTPKGKAVKQKSISKEKITSEVPQAEGGVKKVTRLGLEAKKEENLADWYSQVITKGELIEYYDVSGCYIFRPWSFAIWEKIRDWFDSEIKKLGVQNCYFPIFVSKSVLEKEKTHIADFAPEVAWVTKSGNSDMAEPIAVRPTSETVMYPAYAKWIQSYRDLPIKLNQWNNVVRWEFKHPQPFLRTREFLWQEGHTAYAQKDEACEEVAYILDLYAKVYTDLLAIPVVKGRKTVKEQFAGGDYTLTVEAFVSASGRAIQGATSHHLGQNFSKMFDIIYEDPDTQEKKFVYQNSWGMTTRTIGVMIMVHADNKGLVLPPRIAAIQVVIVPCGITAGLAQERKDELEKSCEQLEKSLEKAGVRVKGDYRSIYSPGWKFNHWELKGVPIRVELGPKDIENKQIVAVRRDSGEKIVLPRVTAVEKLKDLLEKIHENMYIKALHDLNSHKVLLRDWSEFASNLDKKNIILAPFCGDSSCEDKIKSDSARNEDAEPGAPSMGAKSLCIPLEQPSEIKPSDKCIHPECKNQPQFYTLFGRSY